MAAIAVEPGLNVHRDGVLDDYHERANSGKLLDQEQFLKRLKMCAALWGVFYEPAREFDMILFAADGASGSLLMVDSADLGAFSIRAEGLLCRYLLQNQVPLQPGSIGACKSPDSEFWFATLERSEWTGSDCTAEDWDALYQDIDKQFGSFWSSDKPFIRQGIAWFKEGNSCVAQACSKLREEFR